MLYRLVNNNAEVCVLRINTSVLDIPDVVIADRNASSGWASFYPVHTGLGMINEELVFARYWTNPNDIHDEWTRKSCICAEVLVPDRVDVQLIQGVYVPTENAARRVFEMWSSVNVTINRVLFFQ